MYHRKDLMVIQEINAMKEQANNAFEARDVDEVKQEVAHKEVSKLRADKAR